MATEFQHRTRCLLAPGFVKDPKGKGTYILEITSDTFSLISKHWNGDYFDNQELVTTPVRQNSTAPYLIDPSGSQIIFYISKSSTLRTIRYDGDEEVWTDVKGIPTLDVHPEGKIAAAFNEHNRIRTFFQDPHGSLIYVNPQRKTTSSLPASPKHGSPISIAVLKSRIYVFYISARDHRFHYVTETSVDNWTDHTFSKCLLIDNIKQFIVDITADNNFEVYALTTGGSLVQITRERKMMLLLGKVDAAGTFISERSIDHCCNDAWSGTLTEEHLKSYLSNDSSIINTPGGDKNLTPLAAACWRGHFNVVKMLLDQGADPNALSPQNRTPLFYVTSLSPPQNRVVIARALLIAGANVDVCYEEQNYNTPLMNAISIISDQDLVRELLDRGASLSAENSGGQTAESLAEDMGMDLGLISISPRKSTKAPSEWEKRIMELIVALVMFLVQHFKYEDVFQEVMNEVVGTLEETLDDEK